MSEDSNWHVLVKTHGGHVSLLKNLTEDAARQAVLRLRPPWMQMQVSGACSNMSWPLHDGTIVQVEAFGPEGKSI